MKAATFGALTKGDLKNAIIAATPGGIEQQEADGQKEFVGNSVLPFVFNSGTKEHLEAAGVVFGEKIDELFQAVQLPEGWHKKATDHSMWSELIDEHGKKRASIFYKAAFYACSAFINVDT